MICIDASVAAKWLFPEEHSAQAIGLLRTSLERAEPIIAPQLLPIEVANIIRQQTRRGALDGSEARDILAQFLEVPIVRPTPAMLHQRSLVLANEFGLPAIYDAYYVTLAELYSATLWTADQRLLLTLGGRLEFVQNIANWAPNKGNG